MPRIRVILAVALAPRACTVSSSTRASRFVLFKKRDPMSTVLIPTLTLCACAKYELDPPSQTRIATNENHSYGECVVTTTKFTARSSSHTLRYFPNAVRIPCSICDVEVLYHYKGEMTAERYAETAATLICSSACAKNRP